MGEIKIPECCKGCLKYDQFGKECWVFWENKRDCTHHSAKMNGFSV